MPILQNELVMKSIEALHDEALSMMPDTANNQGIDAPPANLHIATIPQELQTEGPKDKTVNAQQETRLDNDIMMRIDHLLEKLNEDDDITPTPPPDERPQSNKENMADDVDGNTTADNLASVNSGNPENPDLSNKANHAHETAFPKTALDGVMKDTENRALDEIGHLTSGEMLADHQRNGPETSDQTKALVDIAAAIYQARQKAVDTVIEDASQNNGVSFDMDVLSATVADEVRRTVSSVIIAELPKILHDAVGEVIGTLPAVARDQSPPPTINSSTAKSVTKRKPNNNKKASAKRANAKKTTVKTPQKKKLSNKKGGANKAAIKDTKSST